ncbi:hypothetical protein GF337_20125 [candidate division KSB1 bacterium]|nr:hypothetical protein [candidate division KSB1 bacterium]
MHHLKLHPVPPYDFDRSVSLSPREVNIGSTGFFEDGTFYRVVNHNNNVCLLKINSSGTIEEPEIHVESTHPIDDELQRKIKHILEINIDLKPFYNRVSKDPFLAELVQKFYGIKIIHTESLFEALVIAISEQQISLSVAMQLTDRFIRTFGIPLQNDGKMFHAFPQPKQIAELQPSQIRDLKFTTRKAEYIINLAQMIVNKKLDAEKIGELPSRDAITELTKIRGIGLWSAEYALIRGLGKHDNIPADDIALQRIMKSIHKVEQISSDQIRKLFKPWHPYEGYAVFYIFLEEWSQRRGK